jgi:serine phosphatase RsbU (regulator of sigma subunit)
LVKKNEMEVKKGNRYPIGGWQLEKKRNFEPQSFKIEKGNRIFLGSDGFQDQIGGKSNKRYRSKKLHDFIFAHRHLNLVSVRKKLNHEFETWKAGHDQVDDVCIIGITL